MAAVAQRVSTRRTAPGGSRDRVVPQSRVVPRGGIGFDAVSPTLSISPAIARGFAAAVEGSVRLGVLSYDDRLRLLDRGVRLGLSRFEATLIIAAVQHRVPGAVSDAIPMASKAPTPNRHRWLVPVAFAVTLQGAILAAIATLLG
jgi:hypothetical protein